MSWLCGCVPGGPVTACAGTLNLQEAGGRRVTLRVHLVGAVLVEITEVYISLLCEMLLFLLSSLHHV